MESWAAGSSGRGWRPADGRPILNSMRAIPLIALAVVLAAGPAAAQLRSYDIMVEEGGKPLKKRDRKAIERPDAEPRKKPEPKARPRGSSYIPPTALPRTEAITIPQAPGVYTPPRVNTFGDRVINCNHSFPLNAGIGNNPTDRGSYVRQCAN
jgi:hypothetical protein